MEVLFPRFTVFLTGSTKGREREDSEGEKLEFGEGVV